MARAVLSTKGFEEYLERIATAGENVDDAADEALAAGGQVLVDGMQQRAPEAEGNLKQHIGATEPKSEGGFHWIEVGIQDVDRETEMYFFYQEMGTASMAAHPYVRPTLDNDARAARAAMLQVFKARKVL